MSAANVPLTLHCHALAHCRLDCVGAAVPGRALETDATGYYWLTMG